MAGTASPPRDDRIYLLPGPDILFRDTRLDGPGRYPSPPPQYSWSRSSSPKAAIIILVVAAALYSTCITGILLWQWRKYRRDVLQRQNRATSELARSAMRATGVRRGREQDGQSTGRAVSSAGDSARFVRDSSQRQSSRDSRSSATGANDSTFRAGEAATSSQSATAPESWGDFLRLHFSRNSQVATHLFPDVFAMWNNQQGDRRARSNLAGQPASTSSARHGASTGGNTSAHPHRFHRIHRTGTLPAAGTSGSRRSHRPGHAHGHRHGSRSAASLAHSPPGSQPGGASAQGGDAHQGQGHANNNLNNNDSHNNSNGQNDQYPWLQGQGMRRGQSSDSGRLQAVSLGATMPSGSSSYGGGGPVGTGMMMAGGRDLPLARQGGSLGRELGGVGARWGYSWADPPPLPPRLSPTSMPPGLGPPSPPPSLPPMGSAGSGLMLPPQQQQQPQGSWRQQQQPQHPQEQQSLQDASQGLTTFPLSMQG